MLFKAKVGLICIGLEGERIDYAREFEVQAREHLKDVEILNEPGVLTNKQDITDKVRQLQSMDADAFIFLVGTWILADGVVDTIQKAQGTPVAIWGIPEPVSFSGVGANVLHGALCEMDIQHKLFYGTPDDPDTLLEITDYCAACMATMRLRGARLGLIGGRSISAYPTAADPNQIKAIFGVEVDHIDQMVVLEKARAIKDADALSCFGEIKSKYKSFDAPEDVILKSMKVHMAVQQVIDEYKLDMATIKCLGDFINTYTSCCMAVTLSNDAGRVLSCQCNINATLSMYIMKLLSGNSVTFGDVSTVDYKTREVRVITCGAMPTNMSQNHKDVSWIQQYEYMGKGRGVCPLFCMKEGPVTFGYLGRRNGKYEMLIAPATAFEKQVEEIVSVRTWPQGFMHIDGDPKEFYHNILSNHTCWGYGDFSQRLLEFCELNQVATVKI